MAPAGESGATLIDPAQLGQARVQLGRPRRAAGCAGPSRWRSGRSSATAVTMMVAAIAGAMAAISLSPTVGTASPFVVGGLLCGAGLVAADDVEGVDDTRDVSE